MMDVVLLNGLYSLTCDATVYFIGLLLMLDYFCWIILSLTGCS